MVIELASRYWSKEPNKREFDNFELTPGQEMGADFRFG